MVEVCGGDLYTYPLVRGFKDIRVEILTARSPERKEYGSDVDVVESISAWTVLQEPQWSDNRLV